MSKLEELLEEYQQAEQNFNYADAENLDSSIYDLFVLERFISKELKNERKCG